MRSVTGSLAAHAVELPDDAVAVSARHEPAWATAEAVERALWGEAGGRAAAKRLRTALHELRAGAVPPELRWRDRWRRAAPGRPVVVRHGQDLDPQTAHLLQVAIGLGHPVHVVFDARPPSGPAYHLARQLGLGPAEPEAAVVRLPDDPAVRLVLRAAAGQMASGQPFEVHQVAERLDLAPVRVLEHLQRAVDAGFPLADHGGGRLSMPPEARWALAEGLLPSLQEAWSRPTPRAPEVDKPAPAPAPSAPARAPSAPSDDEQVVRGREKLEEARALRARPGLGVALQPAIAAAREAVELLQGRAVHESAAAKATLAHLLVEHGDPPALDEALDHVVSASRELATAGDAVSAAALLNDQAEVWLKLGDPVRAAHLLHAADEGLAGASGPMVELERADTAHLMARLPLYARPRPGQQGAALEQALRHLAGAEAAYSQAGWLDRQAHVLDTRGRLLARQGEPEAAVAALQQAAELCRRLSDGLGLARSTEGLAGVWAAHGHPERAAALLEQSIVLNAAAASPAGLAFVRRACGQLPEGPLRQRVEARLREAEASVGVSPLPPPP